MKLWLEKDCQEPKRANDTVVIFGDGRCLGSDISAITHVWKNPKLDRFSIGRSYQRLANITHWGTADAESSIWWAENLSCEWADGRQTHTLGNVRGFRHCWHSDQKAYDTRQEKWYGSSSLFATLACVAMGYERIILAGCPLDSKGHFYSLPEDKGPLWDKEDFEAWRDFKKQAESKRVRSLSGFTRRLLGEPTRAWLT